MARVKTVLVVDDEPRIVQLARDYLEHAGFSVLTAGDGSSAVHAFRTRRPDLVVLDLGLPELDGLDVTRTIRARVPDPDRDAHGARRRARQAARPRARCRRLHHQAVQPARAGRPGSRGAAPQRGRRGRTSDDLIAVGDLRLDVPRMRVEVAGAPADLTPTEFALLATMARQPGRIFTRSQLLDAVHGVAFESYERAIDAHVKNIRRKIEPDPREPRYVLTVYGVGYRVAEPAP